MRLSRGRETEGSCTSTPSRSLDNRLFNSRDGKAKSVSLLNFGVRGKEEERCAVRQGSPHGALSIHPSSSGLYPGARGIGTK